MSLRWEGKIVDQKEYRVFEALSDPRWDFRTIEGIARAVELTKSEIKTILDRYPELVRKSAVSDCQGRELFTLSSKPVRASERLALLRTLLAKSVS